MSKNFILSFEINNYNIFKDHFILLCFPFISAILYRFYYQLPLEEYISHYKDQTKVKKNNMNNQIKLVSYPLDYFLKLYLIFFSYFVIKEYCEELVKVNLNDFKSKIVFGYYSLIFITFFCFSFTNLFIKYFTWFSIMNLLSLGIFFRNPNNYTSLLVFILGKINVFAFRQKPWKYSISYIISHRISSIIPLIIFSKLIVEYFISK
jgi:hypothetical protein